MVDIDDAPVNITNQIGVADQQDRADDPPTRSSLNDANDIPRRVSGSALMRIYYGRTPDMFDPYVATVG